MLTKITIPCIIAIAALSPINKVSAQKLPNKQMTSLRAPADVKIDGRTAEWADKLQAYNTATQLFYTVSNDNDHLYLTFQAKDPDIANKVIKDGITFTVQKQVKKTEAKAVSITYPKTKGLFFTLYSRSSDRDDMPQVPTDVLMRRYNDTLNARSKTIGIKGIVGVDTLISVYNDEGIKAASRFDNKKAYTVELSIALKHLRLSAGDQFAYHVIVNGRKMGAHNMMVGAVKNGQAVSGAEVESMIAAANMRLAGSAGTTDFWGTYTLAK